MTERLATLLHDEVDDLEVPTVPAQEILRAGRRRAGRRRRAIVGAGVAALSVAAGAVALLPLRDDPHVVGPAEVAAFRQWGAIAVGRDVHIGDTHVRWDGDIAAMYYSADGVVVRSGGDYALVRADGVTTPISVDIPDRIPGFEPDSSRFAYVDALGGDRWEVVVHDARSDEELARVAIAGSPYGGWTAPPAAIDGDLVWVHLRDRWVEVDWRTGSTRDVPGTGDTYEVANGAYAVQTGAYAASGNGAWQVRSWTDGSLIGTAMLPRGWYAFFSPDGRYLRAFPNTADPESWDPEVFDAATGRSRTVRAEDFGWTPDGDLLIVENDELRVCPPISGPCQSRPFDRGSGALRIGGNPYES